MTFYQITFYCDDELATGFTTSFLAKNGDAIGAATHAFEKVPPLPKNIVGVIVTLTYLH